jgi:hypothetical protein
MPPIPFGETIRFHARLNPRLWRHDRLRVEVRLKLLQAAIAFYRFLDLPGLRVNDIIVTGSNAAFNYTRLSDVDVHLIVDFSKTSCPALADNFFNTKRNLWARTYNVAVRGHAVELYVENTDDPVNANGIYSVLHSDWLKIPKPQPPPPHDTAIEQKATAIAEDIDSLLEATPSINDINEMLARLYTLRQNGLLAGGEFATENLAFKALRNAGYIDRLHAARTTIRDRELSLTT